MAEYINREDAKKALIGWDTDPTDEEIEYALDNIPTADAVEVVRCRDCRHYKFYNLSPKWEAKKKSCLRAAKLNVNEDDYCSYGERRSNDESV